MDGLYVCTSCGIVLGTYDQVIEWIPEIWKHKKSIHSRKRWFYNKIKLCVNHKDIDILVGNFQNVINVMEKNNLINGRNISRYNYYIMRLASRRNIELNIQDAKGSKTNNIKKGKKHPKTNSKKVSLT